MFWAVTLNVGFIIAKTKGYFCPWQPNVGYKTKRSTSRKSFLSAILYLQSRNWNNRAIIAGLRETENMKSNALYTEQVGFLGFCPPLFVQCQYLSVSWKSFLWDPENRSTKCLVKVLWFLQCLPVRNGECVQRSWVKMHLFTATELFQLKRKHCNSLWKPSPNFLLLKCRYIQILPVCEQKLLEKGTSSCVPTFCFLWNFSLTHTKYLEIQLVKEASLSWQAVTYHWVIRETPAFCCR